MCFSAEASFVSGVVLLPLGVYGMVQAARFDKRYLLFAFMPLIFGVQQLIEGMIWLNWHQHDSFGVYQAALQFTFIAFFLWPMYSPLSIYLIERNEHRKKIMGYVCMIGFLLGCIIYLPMVLGESKLHVQVIKDSITYKMARPIAYSYFYVFMYLIVTIFPMLYCSLKEIKVFGILSLGSAICAALVFHYAFASTWCFFSAVLSTYTVYCLHKLQYETGQDK